MGCRMLSPASQCRVAQTAWELRILGGQWRLPTTASLPSTPFVIIRCRLLDFELSSERKMFKEQRGQEEVEIWGLKERAHLPRDDSRKRTGIVWRLERERVYDPVPDPSLSSFQGVGLH